MDTKVLCWFLCFSVTFSVGLECGNEKKNDEILIHSTSSCSIEFQITSGYQMEAEIEKLELDSSDQSYLLLNPEHDEKEYKFVWTLKEPKKFIIDQSRITVTFETKNAFSQFRIRLKRHGPLTTTTEPTTIATWPTPVENDTIYHTVNLTASTVMFKQQELAFKQVMVNMTVRYCERESIHLEKEVTIKNIDIYMALQCPSSWPNYLNCTQVRYAIPVFLNNSDKYELTSEHLDRMWRDMAPEYLQDVLAWDLYKVPDNASSVLWWLIVIVVVIVLFLGVLFFTRMFAMRFGDRLKRRASDTEQIMATPKRVSDASLWPTTSQVIPPLFSNDTAYVYYEPDTSIKVTAPIHPQHQINKQHMLDVDDSSDEEILTVNSNSTRTSYNQSVIHLDHDAHNRESAL